MVALVAAVAGMAGIAILMQDDPPPARSTSSCDPECQLGLVLVLGIAGGGGI